MSGGAGGKPHEPPVGLVDILSRLITAHRRLYGAHKDADVLQEAADMDPTKVRGAGYLQVVKDLATVGRCLNGVI
jgi:hypothetical protein